MPGWQSFYNAHKEQNFEILSIAVDLQGSEVVSPYIKDTTFTTAVDEENQLANYFGFKVVPNGIFIDQDGIIRLMKQGFKVDNDEHVQAVTKLVNKEIDKVEFDDQYYQPKNAPSTMEKQLAETKFKLSMEYSQHGKKEKAVQELDQALMLDSDNFLIRKQRWYLLYPEKFSPTIDIEWQQYQLEKEKQDEAQLKDGMVCGPEGCYIPGT